MKIIKNKMVHVLAFIIPIIVLGLVFFIKGCFTKNVFFASDMYAQYVPLFGYLKDFINGKQSLFYSFSKGLGGGMFGTFAYYLASPLNIIVCLFSKESLYIGLLILLLIKIGLSGLTMSILLKDKIKEKKFVLLFSICYALMAYNVNYYFNIMWLDGIYLAPLVVLGIEKLMCENKKLLYVTALFFSIVTNYYIGFMICIFSLIYFIYQVVTNNLNKKDVIKALINFIFCSIFAVLCACIILVPTALDLLNSTKTVSGFKDADLSANLNIFNIFSKGYLATHDYYMLLNKDTVNWYCGIIVVVNVLLYFINSKIKKKDKIYSLIVIAIFIISFSVPFINMIWHGFNNPICFNYRYSFLFSLFLILLASKNVSNITIYPLHKELLIIIFYLIVSLVVIILNYDYVSNYMVWISCALFAIYFIFIVSYYKCDLNIKNKIPLLLLFLTCAELLFQSYYSIRNYNYISKQEYVDSVSNKIVKKSNNSFYRHSGTLFSYVFNESLLNNTNSVSTFLSTTNSSNLYLMSLLGVSTDLNKINYQSKNGKILDSILGVKYIYNKVDDLDYKKVDDFSYYPFTGLLYGALPQKGTIYENSDALSLGFMVNNKILTFIKRINNENYSTKLQNILLNTMVDSNNDYFKLYEQENVDNNTLKAQIDNDKLMYGQIDFSSPIENAVKIYINDELVSNLTYMDSGIFQINNKYEGNSIEVKTVLGAGVELNYPLKLYYFDNDAFNEDIEKLKNNQLEITKMGNTYVKGKINVEDNNVLFTSIPYESGWTLKVDGKKTKIICVAGAFLGAKLPKGEHKIELTYHTPGLLIGIITSIIGLILTILFIKKGDKFVNKLVDLYIKFEEIILYLVVGATTMVISVGSYALLSKVVHLHYQVCNILSWIIAVTFAYILNKIIVFKSKTKGKKELFKEIYEFVKYRIISLIGELGFMYLFVSIINMNDVIAKVIVQVLVVIANYVFSKLFIFKKNV